MNDGVGLKRLDRGFQKIVIGNVADEQFDGLAGYFLPDAQAVGERSDGSKSLRAELMIPLAAQKIVDNGDGMAFLRQIQSSGPTAISVSTEYGDFHMAPNTVLSTTALAVHRIF